jgi:hypothetical protein
MTALGGHGHLLSCALGRSVKHPEELYFFSLDSSLATDQGHEATVHISLIMLRILSHDVYAARSKQILFRLGSSSVEFSRTKERSSAGKEEQVLRMSAMMAFAPVFCPPRPATPPPRHLLLSSPLGYLIHGVT